MNITALVKWQSLGTTTQMSMKNKAAEAIGITRKMPVGVYLAAFRDQGPKVSDYAKNVWNTNPDRGVEESLAEIARIKVYGTTRERDNLKNVPLYVALFDRLSKE